MAKPYIRRHTRLHPRLWAPYRLHAYPHGFHDWPGDLALPVWVPEARIIDGRARLICLGDQPTLDAAIDACWAHLAGLMAANATTSRCA